MRKPRCLRLAALVGAGVLAGALAACGGPSTAISAPPPDLGSTLSIPLPDTIANLPLTTDTDQHTSLAAYRGKTVVLTDILTLCTDACPLVSQEFADMDRQLAAAHLQGDVQLVELTVDPERDTPARLAAYRKIFGAPANWSMLTASPATIKKIWNYFGVYYQKGAPDEPGETDWWTGKPLTYDVDHSDDLIYLDAHDVERFVIEGLPDIRGQKMPPDMTRTLDSVGEQHYNHPAAGAWTTPQAMRILEWVLNRHIDS